MNRRERLTRCYFHQEIDRPAVFTRTGYPENDPSYDRLKAYMKAHSELKRGWSVQQVQLDPLPVETKCETHSADFDRYRQVLHTPKGDLERTWLASRRGQPGLHETFFVKEPDDIAKYLSLPIPRVGGEVDSFAQAQAQMSDSGIIDAQLGFNPGGFAAELMGSEAFALMSVTDRPLLYELCRRRMQIIVESLKYVLARGVGPFFSMAGEEYVVPPLHGEQDFLDFNAAYDQPILDLVHEAGGAVHVHCHGRIAVVLPHFVAMGVDVLHPLEPPPMGDVTAAQAKALAGRRLCLEGNIQIHRLYEASPQEVRAETKELIAAAFGDRQGLIVCPSASPYIRGEGEACFPQYQAMVEAVLECGG